jgi:hypothetical protein
VLPPPALEYDNKNSLDFFFFFKDSISLYSPEWHGTTDHSASVSLVLGLQVCTTRPGRLFLKILLDSHIEFWVFPKIVKLRRKKFLSFVFYMKVLTGFRYVRSLRPLCLDMECPNFGGSLWSVLSGWLRVAILILGVQHPLSYEMNLVFRIGWTKGLEQTLSWFLKRGKRLSI